ncbi:MAG: trans-2-enoyl-CoA reductase family protein [Spirochaetales bacterium]|nr:trans-2-enoyl-CoA reductase family protein [Spirochaetales bacterium]
MIITPMVRNNICMNAHPDGCASQVLRQIEYAKKYPMTNGPKNVLVIGSSTGYGLASRIVSAFSSGAATYGIFYEREGGEKRSGSAGWYNNISFEKLAREEGLKSHSINGDAFSDQVKEQAVSLIRENSGTVDMVIYSLAAPVRVDPVSGETHRSVIKPIGNSFSSRTLDSMTGDFIDFHLDPATDEEIAATIKVMGGEDWERWIQLLGDEGVLDPHALTVAYSYIGPPATKAMYRDGTIGRAKEHLEETARRLNARMGESGGSAYVSVNKALVTRASAVIPVVPLYISLLFGVMKTKNIHEDCIQQIVRLYSDKLFNERDVPVDEMDRIRMDDLEMREDVQAEVDELWSKITVENFKNLADFDGYWKAFLQFHGFGVDQIDYSVDVKP